VGRSGYLRSVDQLAGGQQAILVSASMQIQIMSSASTPEPLGFFDLIGFGILGSFLQVMNRLSFRDILPD